MRKYILILTQDSNNKSVDLLKKSLQNQIEHSFEENYTVLVWDVKKVTVANNRILISPDSAIIHFQSSLVISDLALVIKRTWGPVRKKALLICRELENQGTYVLNGCEFISWSHSKIKQYDTLKNLDIFPPTVCFGRKFMSSIDGKSDSEIVKEVLDKINSQLKFPLIFKTDEGCRGDGVYLIESPEELKALIYDLLIESSKMNVSEFKSGFLLQEFIGSHNDKAISNYYRINLVNGQPQSAVQLQLQWKKFTNRPYQKLFDFDEAEDKPVPLESFPTEQLKKIANACPYKNGVVGIDAIHYCGKMFLLEYNDGPAISLISELAEKYKNTLEYKNEVAACANFVREIASLCINSIKPTYNNALESIGKIRAKL